VYATYICVCVCVCLYGDAYTCVCVCVLLEPCDIPHGRQKDNVRVEQGGGGGSGKERMEKEESRES